MKNLPLRIKDLPCLVCQRLPDQSFREVLKTFQLFVSPAMRINNRSIYQHFKSFGEIVSFYTVESQYTIFMIYLIESEMQRITSSSMLKKALLGPQSHPAVWKSPLIMVRLSAAIVIWINQIFNLQDLLFHKQCTLNLNRFQIRVVRSNPNLSLLNRLLQPLLNLQTIEQANPQAQVQALKNQDPADLDHLRVRIIIVFKIVVTIIGGG